MARSYGALKVAVWEPGSDFRSLSLLAQWGYVLLISQPQLNNLGIVPYTPEKWVRFAAGLNQETLAVALVELQNNRYVVVDVEAAELLVRTFIKHDKIWQQPKLITNARRLIREVESPGIRDVLVTRHPWLLDSSSKADIEEYEIAMETLRDTPIGSSAHTPSDTPSDTPKKQGVDNVRTVLAETPIDRGIGDTSDTHIPTRARAGPGPGVVDLPTLKARTKAVNAPNYEAQTAADEQDPNATETQHAHEPEPTAQAFNLEDLQTLRDMP